MNQLTAAQAAKMAHATLGLPVRPRQVVSWVRRGVRGRKLAATKPLGHYLIREADLEAFLGYLLAAPGTIGLASPPSPPMDAIDQALRDRYGI